MSVSITHLAVIYTKLQLLFQSFKILNRSVLANDAQDFATFHLKINPDSYRDLQSPNVIAFVFAAAVVGVLRQFVPIIIGTRVANFEIRIFLAPYFVPPAVQVMAERARPYLPEAVLLGDVFGF